MKNEKKTQAISLGDGSRVCCDYCGKLHELDGYRGNNMGWKDSAGWFGTGFDIAHGFFYSEDVNVVCPECRKKPDEELKKINQTISFGFNSINEKYMRVINGHRVRYKIVEKESVPTAVPVDGNGKEII